MSYRIITYMTSVARSSNTAGSAPTTPERLVRVAIRTQNAVQQNATITKPNRLYAGYIKNYKAYIDMQRRTRGNSLVIYLKVNMLASELLRNSSSTSFAQRTCWRV